MRHWQLWRSLLVASMLALALLTSVRRPALAVSVVQVSVSPGVVPVGIPPQHGPIPQSSVLVAATISSVPSGTSVPCTASLTSQTGGSFISGPVMVQTSPAAASGVTSLSTLMTVPWTAHPGLALATVTCGGATGASLVRISSQVALNVVPLSVPAGGSLSVSVLIATNGALPFPVPCVLTITTPPASTPALVQQVLNVSGGSPTAPASASVTATLPTTAAAGPANASVSCVLQGTLPPGEPSTVGDSQDFTITNAGVVTIAGIISPVVPGGLLSVTAVTVPGFVCMAEFTPPTGARINSSLVTADNTGTAVLTVQVPAATTTGTGSLLVICTDPSNPLNSAVSATQALSVVSSLSLPLSASITGTQATTLPGQPVSVSVATVSGAMCSIVSFISADGNALQLDDPGASGVVPANGALTLSFAAPQPAASGTAVLTINCNSGGLQSSTRLTLTIGSAATPDSCSEGVTFGSSSVAPGATAPVAITGSTYTGSAGNPVQFSGAGTHASVGASLLTCLWSFGDGQTATQLSPTHTYSQSGTYQVTLTVTDSAGLSATASATATVSAYVPLCAQPALGATAALTACGAGLTCLATSLPDQCLPPCSTLLPSNTPEASLCPQPGTSVQIATGGPYAGSALQPLVFRAMVNVSGTRRLCAADATLGAAGPVCQLVPADDLPSPVEIDWAFGDGTDATGASVSHSYSQAGSYPVTVVVTFDDQSIATATTVAQISGAAASQVLSAP